MKFSANVSTPNHQQNPQESKGEPFCCRSDLGESNRLNARVDFSKPSNPICSQNRSKSKFLKTTGCSALRASRNRWDKEGLLATILISSERSRKISPVGS